MTPCHRHHRLPLARVAPVARAVRQHALWLAVAAGAAAWTGAALAQTPASALPAGQAVKAFSVPAGPLDAALDRFARIAGVNLSYDAALIAGRSSRGLSGSYGVEAGLRLLLDGTGVEALPQPGGGYALRPVSAVPTEAGGNASGVTLPQVQVLARAEQGPDDLPRTYAGGQVATGARLGMLGNKNVFETPFSTKAYTAEYLQDQGAREINDAIATDPSIRATFIGANVGQINIRGFPSQDYLFDGLPNLAGFFYAILPNFERLEFLKGPSAALNGLTLENIGGTFNLVPKRALDTPTRSVTFSVIDKSVKGTNVDIGQRFGVGDAFGVRLSVTAEDGTLYNGTDRRLLAPQLAADFRSDRFRATLDLGSVNVENRSDFVSWRVQPGASVPAPPDPRVNPRPEWVGMRLQNTYGVLSSEFEVSDQVTLYGRFGRYTEKPSRVMSSSNSAIDSSGRYTTTDGFIYNWKQDNDVADVGARFEARLGETRHSFRVNALYTRNYYHAEQFATDDSAGTVVSSIYSQSPYPRPFASGTPAMESFDYAPTYVKSFAVSDDMSLLDDRLKLTVALRRQQIRSDSYDQGRTTPLVAALYKLTNQWSLYGNYAESLSQGASAPADAANAGQTLPPYVGKQHEVGVKWNAGTYGVTLALFDIRKAVAITGADNVFRDAGRQRNRGVELEAFGELTRGVRLLGGMAYIDSVQSRTQDGATDGKKGIGTPAFTLNLQPEFDIAAVPGLTLTTTYIHTAKAYVDEANTQVVPAWNQWNLGARYKTRVGGYGVTLRAGVDNVLDKTFWTIGGRNYISVAAPRTWKLSTTLSF